jgi:hypothetical protein
MWFHPVFIAAGCGNNLLCRGAGLRFFDYLARILVQRYKTSNAGVGPLPSTQEIQPRLPASALPTRIFFIFSASKISPHLARPVSGRFTNGHLSVIRGLNYSELIIGHVEGTKAAA